MNKILSITTALTLAFAMSSCRSDDEPASAPASLVLMATVYDIDAESSSVWHSGQVFGVYMLAGDNSPVASNVRHIADDRGVTGYLVPSGDALRLPADGSPTSVAAYYPYDESAVSRNHQTTISVREGTAADACLWASASNVASANPKATLGFKSQLAQIHVRLLNDDPAVARIVARISGAPRSCDFDILTGRYTGTPDCGSPIGATVKNLERAFDLTAVVAATHSAPDGPVLEITALDNSGRELRTYPPVALGTMMGLENGRTFEPNTVYNVAGNLAADDLKIQFTGKSPICILSWSDDPDEEFGTIIRK